MDTDADRAITLDEFAAHVQDPFKWFAGIEEPSTTRARRRRQGTSFPRGWGVSEWASKRANWILG